MLSKLHSNIMETDKVHKATNLRITKNKQTVEDNKKKPS